MRNKVDLLYRLTSKPPNVIFFRLRQEINLWFKFASSYWKRFVRRTERFYNDINFISRPTIVISSNPGRLTAHQQEKLFQVSLSVLKSDFTIFGHKVPDLQETDFRSDWRFGKKWSNRYYRYYSFYDEKTIPYDVKFPWELSRMYYWVPVLAWLSSEAKDDIDVNIIRNILTFLQRWRRENPLAYSVNWYPMEASMRIISFVMMLDFVSLLRTKVNDRYIELAELGKQLLLMIEEHGIFVWLNREFTDVRGNHFTANLVALLLASCALEPWKSKKKWKKYALKWLDKEIKLQFCDDGVNFEKSCGYHKLVLELFLLAAIVRERQNTPFAEKDKAVLLKAASFSDAVMRPDGVAANFGDNDDAMVLPFLIDNPRSHGPVVELAKAFFNKEIGGVVFDEKDKLASIFILGFAKHRKRKASGTEVLHFPLGGYVIVRHQATGFFFMADVGEVGMAGRGGHGHNDMLSFELCIAGDPVIIDSGCPCYTADLVKKDLYRSTASHATVELFGQEMARMSGHWLICNDAKPVDVKVAEKGGLITIYAGHNGYERIASGSRVMRKFEVDPLGERLTITDNIIVSLNDVQAIWRFPVGPSSVFEQKKHCMMVKNNNACIILLSDLALTVKSAQYSTGYGKEEPGRIIQAETVCREGENTYVFRFEGCRSSNKKSDVLN